MLRIIETRACGTKKYWIANDKSDFVKKVEETHRRGRYDFPLYPENHPPGCDFIACKRFLAQNLRDLEIEKIEGDDDDN